MKFRVRGWMRFVPMCLCLGAVVAVPWVALRAQNWGGPWTILTAGGILPLPPPPPQGAFGEVIFANAKWLVVQNREGQQFPVAADAIGQFLIRWPADLRDLSPEVLVEAIGVDQGSMTLQTNHIDVFKGSDQSLVQTNYTSVLPINRPVTTIDPTYQRWMNGLDMVAQNTIYPWNYPTMPGDNNIPGQMHAVGNAVGLNPIRLGVPGNNIVTVLPQPPGVMSISQVTLGSPSFAQKGDQAFLTPIQQGNPIGEKTLRLSQLVLYKKVRRDQFVP
jgi:hypothetical protein